MASWKQGRRPVPHVFAHVAMGGAPANPRRAAPSAWTASPPTAGGCRSFPSPGAQSIHEHIIQPRPPSVPGPSVPGPSVPGPSVPGPSVPGPSVPGPCFLYGLIPHPPLWKSPGILRSFTRNTHRINLLPFLSVNYPVNFNPEKTPLFSPKRPALGAKTSLFRPFVPLRLQPLDKT